MSSKHTKIIIIVTKIPTTFLIYRKKLFGNNSLCYSNKKFESFKEVLQSSVCYLRWHSHYLKEINFRTINFLVYLFLRFPSNMYYLLSCQGKKNLLQNYCKMNYQYNLSLLPMETTETRLFLFHGKKKIKIKNIYFRITYNVHYSIYILHNSYQFNDINIHIHSYELY